MNTENKFYPITEMNKPQRAFIFLLLAASFGIVIVMVTLEDTIGHKRRLKEDVHGYFHRNRTKFSAGVPMKCDREGSVTRLNISQTEFEIITEVLRTFRGEFDEKQLRKESGKENHDATTRRKVVMMYTPFFGNKNYIDKTEDFNTISGTRCPFYQCEFTMDKSNFFRSDAVIFHARDITRVEEMRTLQKIRPSHQRWIYFILENPVHTPDPSPYDNMFNWTLTYRANSDLRFRYGNYFPRVTPWKEEKYFKNFTKSKTKLVFWAASHCGLLRDRYVRKFRKFVNLDVFGACGAAVGGGTVSCVRGLRNCTEKLKQYKFALAFENQMCEDYITEKYWDALLLGVVPVVMGGATYDDEIAVPGSYINAAEFPTVQALANYLLYLDKNSTAYMEFFEWKRKYVVRKGIFYFKCALCAKLNLDHKRKVYEKLDKTWSKRKQCGITNKIFHDIISRS